MQRGTPIKFGQSLSRDTTLYTVFQEVGERMLFKKGETIHLQGDEPTAFYMIESGQLRSYLLAEDGRQVTLEILSVGKLFGLASYFGRVPRPTSALAETNLEMLAIDYERLRPFLAKDLQLVTEIFDLMGYSIRMLTIQIDSMSFYDANQRVSRALLQMRNACGADVSEVRCTHQELANLAGLNRVTVTRALQDFVKRNWVELRYGCIRLLDVKALQNHGGHIWGGIREEL